MPNKSKDIYCPECVEILQSGDASRLHEVKNEGGLYHYSGSMNRHRQSQHGVQVVKHQTIICSVEQTGVDLA
jgi:hypothetical protein